jgi:hypothetical protein
MFHERLYIMLFKDRNLPFGAHLKDLLSLQPHSQLPNRIPQAVHVSQLRVILQDLTVTRDLL